MNEYIYVLGGKIVPEKTKNAVCYIKFKIHQAEMEQHGRDSERLAAQRCDAYLWGHEAARAGIEQSGRGIDGKYVTLRTPYNFGYQDAKNGRPVDFGAVSMTHDEFEKSRN